MSLLEKLKLLSQFGDEAVAMLGLANEFQSATTVEAKAQIIVRAANVIAVQTPTDIDDLAAELVKAFFESPQVVEASKRLYEAIVRASHN